MSNKVLVLLISILIVILIVLSVMSNRKSSISITNFDECVQDGNIVLESFPRICRAEDGTIFTEKTVSASVSPLSDLIRVSYPKPHQLIESPIIIEGEAKGAWFFEASFPGRLLDENGTEIAAFHAEAEGEWMTEDFVPFKAELVFLRPPGDNGTIVLMKDNPSGFPKHDNSLRLPVRFSGPVESMQVKIFFSRWIPDGSVDCAVTYPVYRIIPLTNTPLRDSVEKLLLGPSFVEENQGFSTNINTGVKLERAVIQDGVAYLDFNESLES